VVSSLLRATCQHLKRGHGKVRKFLHEWLLTVLPCLSLGVVRSRKACWEIGRGRGARQSFSFSSIPLNAGSSMPSITFKMILSRKTPDGITNRADAIEILQDKHCTQQIIYFARVSNKHYVILSFTILPYMRFIWLVRKLSFNVSNMAVDG